MLLALGCLTLLPAFTCEQPEHRTGAGVWKFWGANLHNTHEAEAETTVGPGNVARLTPKWTFTTSGSVSAIPTL
ncbi:polyvinylalcohol dehydrogenase, partial [bacterium]